MSTPPTKHGFADGSSAVTSTTIRSATPDDVEAILAIMPRLAEFDVPASRDPQHLWMHDAAMLRSWSEGNKDDCFVHVAVAQDERIAGFAMVSLRPELLSEAPSSHLEAIAVAPGFERLGIGARLLRDAESEAARRGAETITLHVFAANTRARSLYEREGYCGELMRYIKPLDA